MKRTLLSILIMSIFSLTSSAQIKIIDHAVYDFIDGVPVLVEPAGTEDLAGTTIYLDAEYMTADNEHQIWVVNESSESLTIRCVRTELSVEPGTRNNVCWGLCPFPSLFAGAEPVWIVGGTLPAFTETIAPGDTVTSFAFHFEPNSNDGCSLFKIEFFDDATVSELYGSFNMHWNHSVEQCVTGVDDLSALETSLSPNPVSGIATLNISGIEGVIEIQVIDLLGQTISKERFNPSSSDRYLIDTSSIGNGIYFISIQDESQVLKTIKMVVRH